MWKVFKVQFEISERRQAGEQMIDIQLDLLARKAQDPDFTDHDVVKEGFEVQRTLGALPDQRGRRDAIEIISTHRPQVLKLMSDRIARVRQRT